MWKGVDSARTVQGGEGVGDLDGSPQGKGLDPPRELLWVCCGSVVLWGNGGTLRRCFAARGPQAGLHGGVPPTAPPGGRSLSFPPPLDPFPPPVVNPRPGGPAVNKAAPQGRTRGTPPPCGCGWGEWMGAGGQGRGVGGWGMGL
uniref:Uncharacterized protein n=1 Tax=Knipowitschia caucasica TaxID=637954 RepID=A0AAV2IV70_KNICA